MAFSSDACYCCVKDTNSESKSQPITDYYAFYKPIGFYHKAGTFVVSDYSTLNSITCNGVQIPVSMTVNGSAYKPGTTAISHTFGSPAVLTSYPSEWGSTWRSVKEYEGGK